MRPHRTEVGVVAAVLAALFGAAVMIGLALLVHLAITMARADWKNVAGEWDQYRLNDSQKSWFAAVKSKGGVPCCSEADGHPTEQKHRVDGYYVPDPRDPQGEWIKIPEDTYTTPGNNPVGTAVVWYLLYNGDLPNRSNVSPAVVAGKALYIRCFVPEAES